MISLREVLQCSYTAASVGFYFYYLYGDIIKIGIIHGSTTTTIPKGKHAPLTPRSPPSIVPMKPSLDDDNDSMNDSSSLVMYRWKGIASDDGGGRRATFESAREEER